MRRSSPLIGLFVALILVVVACGDSEESSTSAPPATTAAPTTTSAPATTTAAPTTTSAPTTTTAAPTTTTAAPTTTASSGVAVPATPVVGVLQPYPTGGTELFPAGSVEAHWYQWDGLYVVLYRGFDATADIPTCPGNSILLPTNQFDSISNSPHLGTADELCPDAPRIAESPSGTYTCGTLLYYVTEIPTASEGNLWGTIEVKAGDGYIGQTTAPTGTPTDLANTPQFEPGLTAYELPASSVDEGGVVACGA
jgi:hypothetical protein